ncbi:hypothetical protein D3C84_1081680 [compost metagenome]
MLQPLFELVQQTFAQGTVGILHPLDGQGGEEAEQYGDRGSEHPLALLGEAGEFELLDLLVLEHLFFEPLKTRQGDAAIGPTFPLQHVPHGTDGA